MLKRMTVKTKLYFGFGVILFILALIVVGSFTGISGIVADASETIYGNELDSVMAQKEVDHLNWVSCLNSYLTDENIETLDIQTNHSQCAFGKWLYSDERKQAEANVPGLAEVLAKIEEPHKHLHESAVSIENSFVRADLELGTELQARKCDHLGWIAKVKDVLMSEDITELKVQTDPVNCKLGKWLNSEEVRKMRADDSHFNELCDGVEMPHSKLHKSSVQIQKYLESGERAEARKYFEEVAQFNAEESYLALDNLIGWNANEINKMQAAFDIYAKHTVPSLKSVQEKLNEARGIVSDNVLSEENMLAKAKFTKFGISIFGVSGVVAGLLLAFVIARAIIKPLQIIIKSINEGAEQVSSAAMQVASASQSLAEGATEQAAGLEETSSSLEEMSSMTSQNADNAGQASHLSDSAKATADRGNQSMEKMNRAIGDIQKSSDETAKIIKVIDEIAFQTNLLALNAAVEAARAGEAGKGFAVVAEEVRNLAMRSAEAAKSTTNLIDESVRNAKSGVDISAEVAEAIIDIRSDIVKSADLISEIAAASKEQAMGIEQVNTSVSHMDKVTQSNAANAEESASASEELSAQAEEMNHVVLELVELVGGKTSGNKPRVRRQVGKAGGSDDIYHAISDSKQKMNFDSMKIDNAPSAKAEQFEDFNI